MKNILKLMLAVLVVFTFNTCEDSDNTIDQVLDYETGAILRTIEDDTNNFVLNSSDPVSTFSVMVEEQDEQDGGLFESVDVYVSIRDLTMGNGTTVADDVFVKNVPATDFSPGPHGLPRGVITATFGEAATAMGLVPADYDAGDLFVFELRLNLTDGRTFGADSAAGIITGGFFSSPFKYNALLSCAPQDGVYTVTMQDAYGDGWQGDGIKVTIDGVVSYVTMQSSYDGGPPCCGWSSHTETVTVPAGSLELIWEWTGDDWPGEVTFQVTGPGGEDLGSFGPEPEVGVLPITLCLP